MIIVDTNVISEFMTSPPAGPVLARLNEQDTSSLYLTTISIAGIGFGLRAMPEGKRSRLLSERFDLTKMRPEFTVKSCVIEKEIDRPMSKLDGQIAAIARSKGFVLATRNIKDFEECQLSLVNPFL